MKKLSIPFQIMLLIVAVLAVYFPTMFADICLIDDYDAISYFLTQDSMSFKRVFFPQSAGGGYYRPLISFSYLLDKDFWFLHERQMHFESVVAHLVNALLVFCICREAVILHLRRRGTWLPFAAALMFSLHPIMTESVNWISGRTDIMMGTFVLASVLCLLRFIQSRSKTLLMMAIISGLIACLAKEAAFAYLVGLPRLAMHKRETVLTEDKNVLNKVHLYFAYFIGAFLAALFFNSYWLVLGITLFYMIHLLYKECELNHIKASVSKIVTWSSISISALTGAVALFVIVRRLAFTSSVSKIGQTVTLMMADLNYTISLFLGAVGFYVKKFFLPLPLNFFILEIDPLYDFVGIAVLMIVCNLIISKKLTVILFLSGLLLLLPVLPFAFGTIAWTAYAERYIYLPSAFWILALCLWGGVWLEQNPAQKHLVTTLVLIICLSAACVTFWRNVVWQSNVTLMRDTVAQTPRIRKLRNIYIKALLDKGATDEALKQYYLAAVEVPSPVGDEQAALMISAKLVSECRNYEALQLYQDALKRAQFKSELLLTASIRHVRVMLAVDNISEQEREKLSGLLNKYSVILEGTKQKKSPLRSGKGK